MSEHAAAGPTGAARARPVWQYAQSDSVDCLDEFCRADWSALNGMHSRICQQRRSKDALDDVLRVSGLVLRGEDEHDRVLGDGQRGREDRQKLGLELVLVDERKL